MSHVVAQVQAVPVASIDARYQPPPGAHIGRIDVAASVGTAVQAAAESARQKIIALVTADRRSPLYGAHPQQVKFDGGRITRKSDPAKAKLLRRFCGARGINL